MYLFIEAIQMQLFDLSLFLLINFVGLNLILAFFRSWSVGLGVFTSLMFTTCFGTYVVQSWILITEEQKSSKRANI